MNRPIRNLAVACMVLFLSLMLNATYLQFFKADDLNSLSKHDNNARVKDATFSEPRGKILVGGTAIARSKASDDRFKYQRVYPFGAEYAHIAGYFSRSRFGGLEQSRNQVLTGDAPGLFVNRLVDLLGNQKPQGGNLVLTLNAKAQNAAYQGLKDLGRRGGLGSRLRAAVVAIEPSTGRILAMVSSPSFDPTPLANHDITASDHAYTKLVNDKLGPLNNRAIEERLPPGSTFKLITAAAALSAGYKPDTMVPGGAVLDLPQTDKVIRNESLGGCGGTKITLTHALDVSCNVAFGSVGLDLGGAALRKQAEKFGFNRSDYFDDLNDSLTHTVSSVVPSEINAPQSAQTAIGQYDVAATPLQMAMVAAGIANNGRVMKPYLVNEVRSADQNVVQPTPAEVLNSEAISPSVASELTQMMVSVVDNGTGSQARIPGIAVAGKTGTAESGNYRKPYAWFVSFAPSVNARVAVAVMIQDAGVDRSQISGGGLAAPIARAVMEAVLNP